MKRKQPTTWTKKIDREGRQFLAGVRYSKWAEKNIEDPVEAKNFVTKVLPQLFPGFAQGRKMAITSEMLECLKKAGMPMGETFKPGEHKVP